MNRPRDPGHDREAGIRADMARYRAACGCEVGSVFTLIALVGLAGFLLTGHGGDWSGPGTVVRALAWIASMSVLGKLVGLGHARLRLVQLARELAALPDPASTSISPRPIRKE